MSGDEQSNIADAERKVEVDTNDEISSGRYRDASEVNGASLTKINSDEKFSTHSSNDEDGLLSLTLTTNAENFSFALPLRQFTKLEVVTAREIEAILRWHHLFVGIGVLFTLILVILTNTAFLDIFYTPKDQGWTHDIRFYRPPLGLVWFLQVMALPMFLYVLALCLIFSTRIFTLKPQSRTKEQYWVVFLLMAMVLYLNPIFALAKINDVLVHPNEPWKMWSTHDWFQWLQTVSKVLRTSGFTATTIFYVWASMHSYRILESNINIMFYLPKVLILLIYVAAKTTVVFTYKIYASELMFASFFGMISVYRTAQKWHTPGVIVASLLFVFELGLGIYIFIEYLRTKRKLKKADYLKYRSKQIGFRFFVYHNMTFYAVFISLYLILLLGLPNGSNVFALLLKNLESSFFEVHDMLFGIQIPLLAYCTVEAYVNLPSDALGFKGWFAPQLPRGQGAEKSELEPITYRKREPPSLHGVVSDLRVNCFVMQTHVTLFNFAWLVYYWDTPKVENFKLTQDVFRFTIAEYIKDENTDTHVLVADGEDRIVIVFKGTTSTKNLKTDVNMFYANARSLLPTKLGETDPHGDEQACDNPLLKTRNWRRAKVHKGFAVAYGAVASQLLSIVKKLQDQKRRPVFLTGHSLGGALATLCSLDLFLRLGMTRKEIFVSTFGAPRVGNRCFWNIYDENVPIHWRIVVGPDVVAKLPKVGYAHVGKKVLLTVDGDLFIDPNSLELNMWSGDVASILYHRKASYLLAMRAWCERHHGDEYLPEFWPFPVSKDDTKRFQHAMVRSTTKSGFLASPRPVVNKRARIMLLDAMVNALDDGGHFEPRIVARWSKLAEGLIERTAAEELL